MSKTYNGYEIPAPTNDNNIFDLRLTDRFITKGKWLSKDVVDSVKCLADLATEVVDMGPPQPALGLFDEETLASVQKNFPYKK